MYLLISTFNVLIDFQFLTKIVGELIKKPAVNFAHFLILFPAENSYISESQKNRIYLLEKYSVTLLAYSQKPLSY